MKKKRGQQVNIPASIARLTLPFWVIVGGILSLFYTKQSFPPIGVYSIGENPVHYFYFLTAKQAVYMNMVALLGFLFGVLFIVTLIGALNEYRRLWLE